MSAGGMNGYTLGSMAAANIYIRNEFSLDVYDTFNTTVNSTIVTVSKLTATSSLVTGLVAGSVLFGALLGALSAIKMVDMIGRRGTMLAIFFFGVCGSVIPALMPIYALLVVFRVLLGVAVGIANSKCFYTTCQIYIVSCTMYVAELAPSKRRGYFGSLWAVGWSFGAFFSYLIGFGYSYAPMNWRFMIATTCIYPILFFIIFLIMPESPAWIEMKRKQKQKQEREMLPYSRIDQIIQWFGRIRQQYKILILFNVRNLTAGVVIVLCQQLTGGTTLVIYATTIFRESGLAANVSPLIPAIILGVWLVVCVTISPFVANNLPRKVVMLTGLGVQALSSFGFAFNMYYASGEVRGYVSIPLIAINIMAYQCGVASLMFLVLSELFSTEIRAFAVGQMNGLLWTLNASLNTVIPLLFNSIGIYSVYWFFSSVAAIGVVVLGFMLPETRKKVIVDTQAELELPLMEEEATYQINI
jgi:major inositol transporter-like SP family MFS transporter